MKVLPICSFKQLPKWSWKRQSKSCRWIYFGATCKVNLIFLLFLVYPLSYATQIPIFRLHLSSDPSSYSPFHQKSSVSTYLLSQLYSPLLKVRNGQVEPNIANCTIEKKTVRCELKSGFNWSDGKPIQALDYLESFRLWANPEVKATRNDFLGFIKNGKAVLAGKMSPESLGIEVQKQTIVFHLESSPSEFLFVLANPLLTPTRNDLFDLAKMDGSFQIGSGAYVIDLVKPREFIRLRPNSHWPNSQNRPLIEFKFIQEDSVALQLYQKNELDYLRRLPTLYIPQFKTHADYYEIPQFRMDYIGFSPRLKDDLLLRKSLSESVDFLELQKLFSSRPRPGCMGLPIAATQVSICLEFQKTALEKIKQINFGEKSLSLSYSKQGGDDHQRSMEWLTSQWRKNLGVNIAVKAYENKIFVEKLRKQELVIFRKGLAPERPTCLAIAESFQKSSDENFIGWESDSYEQQLKQLTQGSEQDLKNCGNLLKQLIDQFRLIPLGPIHFTILVKGSWKGWNLNELNHLDLADLRFSP